jgi:hypothetical protein
LAAALAPHIDCRRSPLQEKSTMSLRIRVVGFVALSAVAVVLAKPNRSSTAEPTDPLPKVSTFTPADDLVHQTDRYIMDLDGCLADEADYVDNQEKIAKQSNTLAVLALSLGLHDQANKYKAHAGALVKAAQALAATKDFASAKRALAGVVDAAAGKVKMDVPLTWEKVAALPELMKQVPLVNTKLTRNVKHDRFKRKARDSAGYAAVIAAIAQGTIADTTEAKTPEQEKQWRAFSIVMRDSAGALNAAIHAADEPAAAKAAQKLAQSCEDCHAVFRPELKAAGNP